MRRVEITVCAPGVSQADVVAALDNLRKDLVQGGVTFDGISLRSTYDVSDDPRPPLTPRQAQYLKFIKDFIEKNGIPPTQRELAAGLGVGSTNAVNEVTHRLVQYGYISFIPNTARGIKVL